VRYLATQARQPVVHYEHTDIGYNYRLSNVLAALGRAQLSRLDAMIERRREIRGRYRDLFADVPGVTLFGEPDAPSAGTRDNCWLTAITVDPEISGFTANDLWEALAQGNIESRPLWKPMHAQPVFADARSFTDGTSDELFRTGLTLPSGSVLTDDDLDRVTGAVVSFLEQRRVA
jgi:dTDP-4-amino-4,6-dideoxygalactose transaminase